MVGVDVECYHLVARVNASSNEKAGLAAIEIGGAEEVLRGDMPILALPMPCGIDVVGVLSRLIAFQGVFHHLIGPACLSVEIDEVFIAALGP